MSAQACVCVKYPQWVRKSPNTEGTFICTLAVWRQGTASYDSRAGSASQVLGGCGGGKANQNRLYKDELSHWALAVTWLIHHTLWHLLCLRSGLIYGEEHFHHCTGSRASDIQGGREREKESRKYQQEVKMKENSDSKQKKMKTEGGWNFFSSSWSVQDDISSLKLSLWGKFVITRENTTHWNWYFSLKRDEWHLQKPISPHNRCFGMRTAQSQ